MTEHEYKDIQKAAVGGPFTHTRAPPVTLSLYGEANPTLYMSYLVYEITSVIKKSISGELNLDIPKDFPIQHLGRFLKESTDLTEYNNGNGMSFYEIDALIRRNREELLRAFEDENEDFLQTILHRIRQDLTAPDGEGGDPTKKIFLTHHRSIQREVACVYTVVKDTINKRIIASFRGSVTEQDWKKNLNARLIGLETPKKIRNKMKGDLQKRVLVHRGFFEYLFDNDRMRGDQRFDGMVADIRAAINGEEGYSVYITGHSLGGALATMFSLKLAGGGSCFDDIPRPITCITWAAPFSGTRGYRTAMEHLEREGLIRHLRITNMEDFVPTIPFLSLLRKRLMKHTGINLRLTSSGYSLEHSSRANMMATFRNTIFKPICCPSIVHWHGLGVHEGRVEQHMEELKAIKLNDLYKDEKIVSNDFLAGQF